MSGLPLKPTAFLDSKGNVSPAWYEYLAGLSGRSSFTIPNNHVFDAASQESADEARDTYFAAHPEELVSGVKVISYRQFQQYDAESNTWTDVTEVVQGVGVQGPEGPQGPQGEPGEPSRTVADSISMVWNDNVATVTQEDWEKYAQFDIDYNGAHFSFNKEYSDTVQFSQGNGNAYRCEMNRTNRTFTFTPYNSSETVVLGIPETQMFATAAARNTYFSVQANANLLAQCPYSLLGNDTDGYHLGLYTGSLAVPVAYDNTKWVDGAIITRGPKGEQGSQGPTGPTGATGATGAAGFSPTITVLQNTSSAYVLRITTATGSFDTPNIMGPSNINDTITSSDSTWSSEKIASMMVGSQTWQPSVQLVTSLPTITNGAWTVTPSGWSAYDATKNYLSRVIGDTAANDGVYQLVAGATSWTRFSDNQDFVDDSELADALANYKKDLKIRTVTLSGTGTESVTLAADENLVIICNKTAGTISISHAAVGTHTNTIEAMITLKTSSYACPIAFAATHKVINDMPYEAKSNATQLLVFNYIEGLNAWGYGTMPVE